MFQSDSEKSFHKYFMNSEITITHQLVLSTSAASQTQHQDYLHPKRGVSGGESWCKELIPFIRDLGGHKSHLALVLLGLYDPCPPRYNEEAKLF